MKLRNKKTGEIGTPRVDYQELYVDTENGYTYNYESLQKMNDEWKDYEEPKPQVVYYIDRDGEIVPYRNIEYPKRIFNAEQNKEIGNYFDTREEAERAVEKLKAWKRLKDKGFRFDGYDVAGRAGDVPICGQVYFKAGSYDKEEIENDLYLLFSGGEE